MIIKTSLALSVDNPGGGRTYTYKLSATDLDRIELDRGDRILLAKADSIGASVVDKTIALLMLVSRIEALRDKERAMKKEKP